ncbi:hypothetical protein CCUS01_05129, partial [Colletotrichum cuscutae]
LLGQGASWTNRTISPERHPKLKEKKAGQGGFSTMVRVSSAETRYDDGGEGGTTKLKTPWSHSMKWTLAKNYNGCPDGTRNICESDTQPLGKDLGGKSVVEGGAAMAGRRERISRLLECGALRRDVSVDPVVRQSTQCNQARRFSS